jgi:hypothetical protein
MHPTSHPTSARSALAVAVALLACAEGSASEPRHPVAGGGLGGSPCPTVAEIETAIGFPVRAVPVAVDGCMYELTGRYRGAFLTLMYQPATRADDVYGEIRQRVKTKGANAQPDRLSVGDGGWGYASASRREAAAVSQARLYHVTMDYNILSIPARADAAIRVIEVAMRTAPGTAPAASGGAATGTAPLDACLLATSAEFSQIAEEKPELAKFASAPTTSFGGAHCDYDGGSIRVYQGKAPAAALEGTLTAFKADKQPRVAVAGIGDKAFFMIPNPDDQYNRIGLLAVYAGPRVVQLTMDAHGQEPITATRPRLERLARLVLPRLAR